MTFGCSQAENFACWMVSLTQWTRFWVNSRSWWWAGRHCVLQSMGSQRVGHDWAIELNWGIILWKFNRRHRKLTRPKKLCIILLFTFFIMENFKHLKVDERIRHNLMFPSSNFQNLSLANFISFVFFTHFPLKITLKEIPDIIYRWKYFSL